jgi:hypothetical protein
MAFISGRGTAANERQHFGKSDLGQERISDVCAAVGRGAAGRLQRSLQAYALRKAALGARLLAALEPRQVNQRARELTRI